MTRRMMTVLASATLVAGLLAGPAAACAASDGPTGAVGDVITGHLFSPGDWRWCT
jgi:hypothetical protein